MKNPKEIPEYYPKQKLLGQSSLQFKERRFIFTGGFFFAILIVLLCRSAFVLTTPPSAETLEGLAKRQYQRSIDLSPYRGTIFDRRSEPLAISIRKPSLFVNPRIFKPSRQETKNLAKLLDMNSQEIRKIASKKSYFYWLKRKVTPVESDAVEKLKIAGLHHIMEPSRYYPSQLASQLIGYVGTDNVGLLGVERMYDSVLRGHSDTAIISRDAKGRMIHSKSSSAAPQKPGQKLHLTIDRVIQEIAEKALASGVDAANSKSGFAIVSDPHTGHILAVANYPKFNPNDSKSINNTNTRNYAMLDIFEPGSVVKPLVIGTALDRDLTSLQEVFFVENGIYHEDNWRIRDSHPSKELNTLEIISHSSNIGTYKIAKRLEKKGLFDLFINFGVGNREFDLGFTQQAFGRISPWEKWKNVRFANVSFGQGFMVSGLEIVQAFGSIANGGQIMKPILVSKIEDDSGRVSLSNTPKVIHRSLGAKAAKMIRQAMAETVETGSGKNARSTLYSTAGKTGTTEKIDPKTRSYSDHLRIASFAGFAPVKDPHLVIYVVVDEPNNKPYYGGTWAAPVFKTIAEESLKYLNVAPDRPLETVTISHKDSAKRL